MENVWRTCGEHVWCSSVTCCRFRAADLDSAVPEQMPSVSVWFRLAAGFGFCSDGPHLSVDVLVLLEPSS